MRISSVASHCFIGTMGLCLLAGCSGSGIAISGNGAAVMQQGAARGASSPPFGIFANGGRSFLVPGVRAYDTRMAHPYLDSANMKGDIEAFSDFSEGVVYLYNSQGNQVGELTGIYTPLGMASDIKGDLYVAEFYNRNIAVFAAGLKSPPTFISDRGQHPNDVDSFNNGAYLAVANSSTTIGGPGSVTIFKGSTVMNTVTDPNFYELAFCAFDANGNVFFDGLNQADKFFVAEISNAVSGGTTEANTM